MFVSVSRRCGAAKWAIFCSVATFACSQGTTQAIDSAPAGLGSSGGNGNTPATGGGNAVVGAENPNVAATGPASVPNPNLAATPNVVPVVQQPNGPAIQYLGRFDTTTDPNLHSMAWPGSQILLGFEGTKLLVSLIVPDPSSYDGVPQNVWIAASVDGGASTHYKLTRGSQQLALGQNLVQGHHTVRIIQRTEAQVGRVQFVAATPDGTMSYTPPVSQRRIEVLGDSGAAGYGADGTYPCNFSAATENAEVAYPNVLGRLLGAEVRNLSFSGKGLVANRDMVNDAEKTLPVLWQRTLPYDGPYVLWDANAWRPQVVVLITGGNDFYNEVPAQASYVGKVSAFVTTLKASYPGVKIFLGASPMLRNDSHPTQRETAIAYLKLVASTAADPNVQFLDIPGPDLDDPNSVLGANGFGCDQHPTAATHLKVGTSMAAAIKARLGW